MEPPPLVAPIVVTCDCGCAWRTSVDLRIGYRVVQCPRCRASVVARSADNVTPDV